MDSETRASAGAIEAAHIAGQNCKQLVLVLHPYKPDQKIYNEPISEQEYIDLIRNQIILRELVTRRGLPVLENIPSGLQRTKEILAGIRDPPTNIASILVVVRGAFDRVNPVNESITMQQCQRALLYLGYPQNLLKTDNLNKIIIKQRASHKTLQQKLQQQNTETNCLTTNTSTTENNEIEIGFDLFCMVCAYLSVLQQEVQESGCISPIKGTNVPPPPVYLTNMQGNESIALSYYCRNISRTSSNGSVPGSSCACEERHSLNEMQSRSRDSGTSSPLPHEQPPLKSRSGAQISGNKLQKQILVNFESIETTTTEITTTQTLAAKQTGSTKGTAEPLEEESDSNDSVFSSNSSINSVPCCGSADDLLNYYASSSLEFRDVYLGGSCMLRTKWRQNIAVPYLKSRGVSFHLPALHTSLPLNQEKIEGNDTQTTGAEERSYTRTRRKCRNSGTAKCANPAVEEERLKEECTINWSSSAMRATLYNPILLDSSRVLLFVISNETRSLAPMTLAAHCIGLMYNVVLCVQMLPDNCIIGVEKLTPIAIKDYNRGRSYLIDLAKRQGVPVFTDLNAALECTVQKIKSNNSRQKCD